MSADLLRRAAEKLREHANAATPAPWTHDAGRVRSPHATAMIAIRDKDQALLIARKLPDSAYAALLHPPVALALAEWLDSSAETAEMIGPDRFAVAVARVILREEQP